MSHIGGQMKPDLKNDDASLFDPLGYQGGSEATQTSSVESRRLLWASDHHQNMLGERNLLPVK